MNSNVNTKASSSSAPVLFKRCHLCGHISETDHELAKCLSCSKAFLPLNYYRKIHENSHTHFHELFSFSDDLTEEDLIKGIHVLW